MLQHFAGKMPILGVCLGHQSIGAAFGGKVVRAKQVMHGKTSLIAHTGVGVFNGLPSPFTVIRYHSLAIERASLPDCLEVTAWTDDGEIMGVRHRGHSHIQGVQFHPESILSEHGHALLKQFHPGKTLCPPLQNFPPPKPPTAPHRTPQNPQKPTKTTTPLPKTPAPSHPLTRNPPPPHFPPPQELRGRPPKRKNPKQPPNKDPTQSHPPTPKNKNPNPTIQKTKKKPKNHKKCCR